MKTRPDIVHDVCCGSLLRNCENSRDSSWLFRKMVLYEKLEEVNFQLKVDKVEKRSHHHIFVTMNGQYV